MRDKRLRNGKLEKAEISVAGSWIRGKWLKERRRVLNIRADFKKVIMFGNFVRGFY